MSFAAKNPLRTQGVPFGAATRWVLLLVALGCVFGGANAILPNARQVEVLRQLLVDLPRLGNANIGNMVHWSYENVADACNATLNLYGIHSCTPDGWVDVLIFDRDIWLGQMPPSMVNMTALRYLWAYDSFNGTFDATWGSLTNLGTFYCYACFDLKGPIPTSWKGMSGMLRFGLGEMHAGGMTSLPDWISTDWPLLREIYIHGVGLTEFPSFLRYAPSLERVDLYNNKIMGTVPLDWSDWPELERLDLSTNDLESVPSDWSGCHSLTYLDLSNNDLSSALPTVWPPSLQYLDASNNQLTGSISSSWPASIELLDLTKNEISQSIPSTLLNLPNLVKLFLGNNRLEGTIPFPPTVNMLNTPLDIYIVKNNPDLGGLLPSRFWALHLDTFDASNTSLSGTIPQIVSPSCMLRSVKMDHTQLSGFLPERLDLCRPLKYLYISNAQLDGHLPPLHNTSIEQLDLSYNGFYGPLPETWPIWNTTTSWGRWNLQKLNLKHNQFSGTLPAGFLDLINANGRVDFGSVLFDLDLSQNRFDLCTSTFNRTGALHSSLACNITAQIPTACGCRTFWDRCGNPKMNVTCDAELPPDPYVAPPFPGWSTPPDYEPSDDPPAATPIAIPHTPSSYAPSTQPLALALLITIASFLVIVS